MKERLDYRKLDYQELFWKAIHEPTCLPIWGLAIREDVNDIHFVFNPDYSTCLGCNARHSLEKALGLGVYKPTISDVETVFFLDKGGPGGSIKEVFESKIDIGCQTGVLMAMEKLQEIYNPREVVYVSSAKRYPQGYLIAKLSNGSMEEIIDGVEQ